MLFALSLTRTSLSARAASSCEEISMRDIRNSYSNRRYLAMLTEALILEQRQPKKKDSPVKSSKVNAETLCVPFISICLSLLTRGKRKKFPLFISSPFLFLKSTFSHYFDVSCCLNQ